MSNLVLQHAGFRSADEVRDAVRKLGIRIEASTPIESRYQPKPENVKKMVTALAMHKRGHTLRVISSKLDVPMATVGKWVREG